MINEPSVMILDEPFRGLDAMTKKLMQEYYANLYENTRRTTFFVTTDIDEAIFLADQILVMTNAPAKVRSVVDVKLPRPRRLEDLIESDDANVIKTARTLAVARGGYEVVRPRQQGSRGLP